jgi:hypothetical protein
MAENSKHGIEHEASLSANIGAFVRPLIRDLQIQQVSRFFQVLFFGQTYPVLSYVSQTWYSFTHSFIYSLVYSFNKCLLSIYYSFFS